MKRLASILPGWTGRTLRGRPWPPAPPPPDAGRAELPAARPFAEMPGPRRWPLVGSIGAFLGADASRLDELFGRLRRRYGDLYRFSHPLRNMETVVVFQPEDIEKVFRSEVAWPNRPGMYPIHQYNVAHGLHQGLFSSNGAEWSELRSVVQQQLSRADSVRPFLPHLESSAARLTEALAADREPSGKLRGDFLMHAYRAAFDVISKVSSGSQTSASPEEVAQIVRNIHILFSLMGELEMRVNTWRFFATSKWKRFTKVMDSHARMADRWAAAALSQPASDEPWLLSVLHRQGLSPAQIKALAFDFLLGGVDTTGISLTCLMYHLAKNPDCQERAYAEICEHVPDLGQVMTQEQISRLSYIRACIKENFRMNSPLFGIGRKLEKDVVLGGFRVPKGTVVFVPNLLVGRLETQFPEPDRFMPERWLCAGRAASPFASLPFSHGRRMCVGRRLAEQELTVLTARVLQRFRVLYEGAPMKILAQIVSIPSDKLSFTLADRRPAPPTIAAETKAKADSFLPPLRPEQKPTASFLGGD